MDWLLQLCAPILAHSTFVFHCDNEASVDMLNAFTARKSVAKKCLQSIDTTCASYSTEPQFDHIAGVNNTLADLLSRNDIGDFFKHCVSVYHTCRFVCLNSKVQSLRNSSMRTQLW